MAEAEDLITDVACHATAYAQTLWRRHRAKSASLPTVRLADVLPRIDLLVTALFGTSYRIRIAQMPAPATFLSNILLQCPQPRAQCALPATDGVSIWLPADSGTIDITVATDHFRIIALQQAMRANRGSAERLGQLATPLLRDVYLLLEAQAADEALAHRLPGLTATLNASRRAALAGRPDMQSFDSMRRPLEAFVRTLLQRPCTASDDAAHAVSSPDASVALARRLTAEFLPRSARAEALGAQPLFKDAWTGELRAPDRDPAAAPARGDPAPADPATQTQRSTRLSRRPEVRASSDDEDDARPGAWMIQASQPHEHAEDPFGMQRPTDRDEEAAAEEYAESLADLAQARLVSTPGQVKELFVSDDLPDARALRRQPAYVEASSVTYPEWDWRIASYRDPGATIRSMPAALGRQPWVDHTLAAHRSLLGTLRRRFEMLRARRTTLRKQLDGDDIDLESCIDGHADFRAGLPMTQSLYQAHRRNQRDMAILLLIDVSGSTDGWISAHRRVIDVEREALLLVCIALDALGEPYSAFTFSGQGPQKVSVQAIKQFDEAYGNDIALRIAALEPDGYTRVGAAIRHASASLMRRPAAHRLLLLLSDGKPNDLDLYDGRYGAEDTRQAVSEARMQGIFPFCLTVDRSAGSYLPAVFGAGQYALLANPDLLPLVLLDWMKRLIKA